MAKVLRVTFPKNCVGCELCVMEAQRQLGVFGLDGSPIRIFRHKEDGKVSFKIDLDTKVNELDVEKIEKICPRMVFSTEEVVGEGKNELVS